MTREQALYRLSADISEAIDKAVLKYTEDNDLLKCYVAPELPSRMADAAISVLRAAAEHEDFLRNENLVGK